MKVILILFLSISTMAFGQNKLYIDKSGALKKVQVSLERKEALWYQGGFEHAQGYYPEMGDKERNKVFTYSGYNAFEVNEHTIVLANRTSIYISYDYGRTMKFLCDKPTVSFDYCSFISEQVLFISAPHGKVYKTLDGGMTWTIIYNCLEVAPFQYARNGYLFDHFYFFDAQHGIICASYTANVNGDPYQKASKTFWFYTSDGGQTWQLSAHDRPDKDWDMQKIYTLVAGQKYSYAFSITGAIFRSADKGKHWTYVGILEPERIAYTHLYGGFYYNTTYLEDLVLITVGEGK